MRKTFKQAEAARSLANVRNVKVVLSDGKVCLYNNGKLLTDYAIVDGKIVWQS